MTQLANPLAEVNLVSGSIAQLGPHQLLDFLHRRRVIAPFV